MAGGGLYVSSASGRLLLRNTSFVSNTASDHGGGISLESVDAVTADGLLLESNAARLGVVGISKSPPGSDCRFPLMIVFCFVYLDVG